MDGNSIILDVDQDGWFVGDEAYENHYIHSDLVHHNRQNCNVSKVEKRVGDSEPFFNNSISIKVFLIYDLSCKTLIIEANFNIGLNEIYLVH